MKERLKQLRKTLGLTMEKFGSNLGVTKTAISLLESGKTNLTDQMIKSICSASWNGKFVNEDWLRTGTGDMFVEIPPEDEVGILVSQLIEDKDNPFFNLIMETMRTYNQLSPENKAIITDFGRQLLNNSQNKKED